jgi:phage terminase large subunit
MTEVELPYNWDPRTYQMPLWNYLLDGGKRAVVIWHRRAGKDATALNWTVLASQLRVGLYWHLLPTYNQGRKIIWDGITKEGKPFLSAWPRELIKSVNNTDMKMELANGSMWQVVGTDYVDRLVGSNPVGCVFSEYSLQDPRAWELIRPILAENGGWALFVYTPRGKNHGYERYLKAKLNPKWFTQLLTVADTGAIPLQAIQDERDDGMSEEMVQQEFYCSFEAGIPGAYYSQQLALARVQNRIGVIPIYSDLPVDTHWDLGMDDSTAIWFTQDVGREIHAIDYYETSGEGLPHFVKVLREKPYVYRHHNGPHDLKVRELGTGKSRKEVARSLGINFNVAKKIAQQEDGIEMVRNIFPHVWFHEKNCERGISALENFRKEYDEKKKTFSSQPVHDWSSHGAKAFQTLAQCHEFMAARRSNIITGFRRRYAPADGVAGY